MKVGVVGSRRRNTPRDKEILRRVLINIKENTPREVILVSGGCPEGADKFAEELAEEMHLQIIVHKPDKSMLPENPKRWHFAQMNYARNTLIAEDSDMLLALVAEDRKGGTEDTIKKARKRCVPVHIL